MRVHACITQTHTKPLSHTHTCTHKQCICVGVKFFNYFCGLNCISCKGTRQTHEEGERERPQNTPTLSATDNCHCCVRGQTETHWDGKAQTEGEGYAGEESKRIRVKSPVEHCINLRQSAITCYFISCFRLSSPRGSLCVCVCAWVCVNGKRL